MVLTPKPSVFQKAVQAIHPQLPLDARQSQQLLRILNISFQKSLDSAHPPVEARNDRNLIPRAGRLSSNESNPPRSDDFQGSLRQASSAALIDHILSNPVMSATSSPSSFIFGDLSETPSVKLSLSVAIKVKQWFQKRLARGEVNLAGLRTYLTTIHQAVSPYEGAELKSKLKTFAAGKDTLAWLNSASPDGAREFWADRSVGNRRLSSMLINCLCAEDDVAEIERMLVEEVHATGEHGNSKVTLSLRRRGVVNTWLAASFKFAINHEDILICFLHLLTVSQRQSVQQVDKGLTQPDMKRIFEKAGDWLASAVTAPERSVSTSLYSTFYHTLPFWAGNASIGRAFLSLYHPTEPNPIPALNVMDNIDIEKFARMPEKLRQRMLRMCLDSAQQFLIQEDSVHGVRMLEHARHSFQRELGADFISTNDVRSAKGSQSEKVSTVPKEDMNEVENNGDLIPG